MCDPPFPPVGFFQAWFFYMIFDVSDAQAMFNVLRQSADADVVAAIERLVRDGPDHRLCRINVVDFATKSRLNEERVIAAFLHAARLGLFDLSWNVLCPGCGGVLDANATLKTVRREEYECALCAAGYEPTLDEMVEVAFTVTPRVRKIAAHDPETLPIPEYFRQIFWSSGIDLPDDFERIIEDVTLDSVELPPGEKAILSLQLPAEFVIVFEPVTHAAQFLDIKGEATRERQNLSLVFNKVRAPTGTIELRPGPFRLSLENRTNARVLPGVWIAGDALHDLLGRRKPFLTAKRLLTTRHSTTSMAPIRSTSISASTSPASRSCSPISRAPPSFTNASATWSHMTSSEHISAS